MLFDRPNSTIEQKNGVFSFSSRILTIKKEPLCGRWSRWSLFENQSQFFDRGSKVQFWKNFGVIKFFVRLRFSFPWNHSPCFGLILALFSQQKNGVVKQKQGLWFHGNKNLSRAKTFMTPKFFQNWTLEPWSKNCDWFSNKDQLLHLPQRGEVLFLTSF